MINEACKILYKQRERFVKIPSILRDAFKYYFGFTILNYFTLGMMLLDFNEALDYYRSMYFIGSWGPITVIALVILTAPKKKREPRKQVDDSTSKSTSETPSKKDN